ncbi:hypothetical protein [Mesorhizobium xinjiangense]|uniref:hypothetical protein n=1 Tax=Mesorhizobium xinjiangense TaxID=2678685 RepID=UPI0012EDB791|nr:hypothetical protein [Mesorhizobium xinjiangense]
MIAEKALTGDNWLYRNYEDIFEMPQPIRGPIQGLCGAQALALRPNHMAMIGLVISSWAEFEDALDRIVLSTFRQDAFQAYRLVLSVVNIDIRQKIILASLESLPDTEEKWKAIQFLSGKKLKSIKRRRNNVAHSTWMVSEKYEGMIIRRPRSAFSGEPHEKWSVSDFNSILTSIQGLTAEAGQLGIQLDKAYEGYINLRLPAGWDLVPKERDEPTGE